VCVIAVSKSHDFLLKVRRLSSFFSTTTPTPSRRRVVIFFNDDARDSTSTTSRRFFHDVGHYPGVIPRAPTMLGPSHQFSLGWRAFPLLLFYETTTVVQVTPSASPSQLTPAAVTEPVRRLSFRLHRRIMTVQQRRADNIDRLSRRLFPLSFVVFNVVYWLSYML